MLRQTAVRYCYAITRNKPECVYSTLTVETITQVKLSITCGLKVKYN